MKFVFHVGPGDVVDIVVGGILILIFLVFGILYACFELKYRFRKWREKREAKKKEKKDE